MSDQWQKGKSYRDALNGINQRFDKLRQTDRVVNHELIPTIESIDGFLFAINAAPEVIKPSQWLADLLPLIQQPNEKPSEAINLIISYALHSKKRLEQQKYALPAETDALKALVPASPLNCFCHGFGLGYQHVSDLWEKKLPKELASELKSQVFALRFFSSTEHARQFIAEKDLSIRPDQLAEEVLKNLPKAADLHVRLGMALSIDQQQTH
jgi:yecA family protein